MLALLTLAAATALVWTAVLLRRGGLAAGCLLVLVAGVCFGPPFFHQSIGPLPISLDRLIWAALVAWCLMARLAGAACSRPLARSDYVLAAFFLVIVVNVLAFDFRAGGGLPVSQLVFYHVLPLGLYWVARQARYSSRIVLGMLAGWALFGVYLSLTAIAETGGLDWLIYPKYIASPEYPEFLGRARGPLLNPSGSGILQGLCLAAAAVLWPSAGRRGKLALGGICLVMLAGIYSTLTRSAWIGAGLALIGVCALAIPRRLRVPAVLGCLLVAVFAGATQWERLISFKRDRALTAEDVADSARLRPILAMVAWEMFQDRPLAGCGLGHYMDAHTQYLNQRPWGMPLEKAGPFIQHNVVLAYLVELGLVGAGLYIIVLSLWLRDAWRLWRTPDAPLWTGQYALFYLAFLVNYLVNGMFHDVTLIPMVNMIVYFLAGMTVSLRQETEALADGHSRAALTPQSRWLGKREAGNHNQASGQWLRA